MPKFIYVQFLLEQSNSNNHFISIKPENKPNGYKCHHIVPRSWKPEWSKESNNLINVSA